MRKLLFALLVSAGMMCHGQEYFRYVGGQKRVFEISETKFLVISDTLNSSDIKREMDRSPSSRVKNTYDLNNRLSVVEMQDANRSSVLDLQWQWSSKEDVSYTSPVFIDETGREIGGLTNQVIVRLKKNHTESK